MLSDALQKHLENAIGFGITRLRPVSGGDINTTLAFNAGGKSYFLKLQDSPAGIDMFRAEQAGLNIIRATKSILTPEVVMTGKVNEQSFLLMDYVTFRSAGHADWIELGRNLAGMHRTTSDSYGLDHNNYIGTLYQLNTPSDKWSEFYTQYRIQPQIDMAENLLSLADQKNWTHLRAQMDSLLTDELPSLIHGDLWSGNAQMSADGPVVYDPAVCFANREMDLAMSMLFGGFPKSFYDSYNNEFSILKSGFDDRIQIYQLYYLLVHVNLFGMSYRPAVSSILEKFS